VVSLCSVTAPALTGESKVPITERSRKRKTLWISRISRSVRDVVRVSASRFEQLVADALDELPSELADALDNVVVVVEDWPTPEQLDTRDGTLLGLYEGVPLTERGPVSYAGALPDRVLVFRGPLCELARDEEDLVEQVRVTVLHELGHHFGLDDDRLRELGWA
jgi:predicted Zn-dependent protease with MMP-like domain